jgi:hypothetical protein
MDIPASGRRWSGLGVSAIPECGIRNLGPSFGRLRNQLEFETIPESSDVDQIVTPKRISQCQ